MAPVLAITPWLSFFTSWFVLFYFSLVETHLLFYISVWSLEASLPAFKAGGEPSLCDIPVQGWLLQPH